MHRHLIFPAVAITAWAQQPAQPPGAAEAEATLRARVEQFYQLEVEKKFRQGEAFAADDTKDDYYNAAKPEVKSFEIESIEMLDATHARVTVRRKVVVRQALLGALDFDLPAITTWKIENGLWVWYNDHKTARPSPFGPIAPPKDTGATTHSNLPEITKMDLTQMMSQVAVDKTSVVLKSSDPVQSVTVSNNLPGLVTLELKDGQIPGVAADLDKTQLKPGDKAVLRLRLTGDEKVSGTIHLTTSPLNKVFDISVSSN